MKNFPRTSLALALSLAFPCALSLLATPARAQTAPTTPAAATTASADTAPTQRVEISAQRQKLDAARNGLSPDTGSSVYRFDAEDLQRLPEGESTPLNQVLLQAPGVVQDSYGQLHVRGDHANLQYRIDGIQIPESISGFGQALQTRLADLLSLITGALPAQYGNRTAGVVDIHTHDNTFANGGSVGLETGSNGHRQASAEVGGTEGALSYYLTGSALRSDEGIENPTSSRHPLHDQTQQGNAFGTISYLLSPGTRLSVMGGFSNNRFQIPDVPGQTPNFSLNGSDSIDSATLDARQKERNRFGVLALQSTLGDGVDYQLAAYVRRTDVHYTPDDRGDLMFNGVAANVLRSNDAAGLQGDLSWVINPAHTLRSGFSFQHERGTTDNTAQVFPADADGNATSDVPETIVDNSRIIGHQWSAYLQDEWTPIQALTVNYGLRYDQVNTVVNEHQLSPRLGAVYDLSPSTRVHVGYACYFTPPPTELIDQTSVAKFAGTTNALPSDANTAVRSERSHYFDAGISQQLSPALTVGLDGYYRNVRHLQDEGQFGNALIYSAFNYQKARIWGLELSANYHQDAFSAYANVALARAFGKGLESGQFNFEQDELDYINSHWVHLDHDQATSASAGVSYRWAEGTTASLDLIHGSGLRNGFANTGHLPAYTQVNLGVQHSLTLAQGLGPTELRAAVTNLFDSVYQIRDGSGIGVGAPQYGPRRGVVLGVTQRF